MRYGPKSTLSVSEKPAADYRARYYMRKVYFNSLYGKAVDGRPKPVQTSQTVQRRSIGATARHWFKRCAELLKRVLSWQARAKRK